MKIKNKNIIWILLLPIALAGFAIAVAMIQHHSGHKTMHSHSSDPVPNAKIGDAGFDAQNDGEFNAVATVEVLPEVIACIADLHKTGTVANVSVLCGAGPDHGRTYWVVNVVVDYKNGKDGIAKTYHYDIYTGKLTSATTQASL